MCFPKRRKSNSNDINAQYNAHKSNKIQVLYSVLRNKCEVIKIQCEGSNISLMHYALSRLELVEILYYFVQHVLDHHTFYL